MPNDPEDKKRVLTRVRRLRGQLDAVERALESGVDCAPILQQIAAIRGATNGLMSDMLETHIRDSLTAGNAQAAPPDLDALIGLIRSYLK